MENSKIMKINGFIFKAHIVRISSVITWKQDLSYSIVSIPSKTSICILIYICLSNQACYIKYFEIYCQQIIFLT